MVDCSACGKKIHRDETVSTVFTQEGKRSFFHKDCEGRADHFSRWKEEAPWAFKPTRLTLAEWEGCGPKKHLGVWQSIFIARRDEDVWCPDCGLKIARQEGLTCPFCNGPVVITDAETTKMVFTHGEPLYKLQLHCTERGEEASTYAIISGYTPVTLTTRRKSDVTPSSSGAVMMLKYQPKGDPKEGLRV